MKNNKYYFQLYIRTYFPKSIDRNRYTNKCLNILNTEQFQKLNRDPTKPTEAKCC